MGRGDSAPILDGELRPRGMGNADESSCFTRPLCELGSRLANRCLREIERQARRHDMPEFAGTSLRCMQLAADDGGETVGAELPRVSDRPIEIADEMLG